jgi:hypothetical protein
VITVLGTGKPEPGSVFRLAHGVGVTGVAIEVVVVLNPAHWPCDRPSTQLGPCECVGAGEFPSQFRFPFTLMRLTSDAACPWLDWIWTPSSTVPSHAKQDPALDRHSKLPWMSTSGPWKPFDAVPLHELIFRFPPTVTLPCSRTELQFFASISPPISDGSV